MTPEYIKEMILNYDITGRQGATLIELSKSGMLIGIEMSGYEQWAEDHGYWHGICPEHGHFWTDSGDRCPGCVPEREHSQPNTGEDSDFVTVRELKL